MKAHPKPDWNELMQAIRKPPHPTPNDVASSCEWLARIAFRTGALAMQNRLARHFTKIGNVEIARYIITVETPDPPITYDH